MDISRMKTTARCSVRENNKTIYIRQTALCYIYTPCYIDVYERRCIPDSIIDSDRWGMQRRQQQQQLEGGEAWWIVPRRRA